MARVILFGGGDGGGLIIGPDGIKPIPPWDPDIARGLRSIAALTQNQETGAHAKLFGRAAEELSMELIPRLVGEVGELQGDSAVVFAGFDGDFVCGSTGKRPLPIPRPKALELLADEIG